MQDKLYDWKYTGHVLAILYIAAIYCLPWAQDAYSYYSVANEQPGNNAQEPPHVALALAERSSGTKEEDQTEHQIKNCAGSFICRVVDYRAIKIVDGGSDEPVALFTIVLAISTIGLWLQTERLAEGGERQADITLKMLHATRARLIVMKIRPTIITIRHPHSGQETYMVRIEGVIHNTGAQPALNTFVRGDIVFVSPNEEPVFPDFIRKLPTVIGPGQETLVYPDDIAAEELRLIFRKQRRAFVRFEIEYFEPVERETRRTVTTNEIIVEVDLDSPVNRQNGSKFIVPEIYGENSVT